VEDAPYVTTIETLDKYTCDFCVHGGKFMPDDCHYVISRNNQVWLKKCKIFIE